MNYLQANDRPDELYRLDNLAQRISINFQQLSRKSDDVKINKMEIYKRNVFGGYLREDS